jgi:hypothetical protein
MDLFIGLAYLSHRETTEYPALDIALKGKPLGRDPSIENVDLLVRSICEVPMDLQVMPLRLYLAE